MRRRNVANIYDLGVKELWSLWRDPMMLVLIVYVFTASVYTKATSMPETLHNAPIAIVDEDNSALSQRVASAFYPPQFTQPAMIDYRDVDPGMDAGLYTFALVIPPNFQRDVLAGRSPAVQLNVDATRMSQAFTGSGYIQQIFTGEVNEFVKRYRGTDAPPVDLALRARFNPALDKAWFGSVVQIINHITLLSIILTGAALIREREHGTIEHLLVMPVTPAQIMLSKVWSMALVVLIASFLSLNLMVRGVLGVAHRGLHCAVLRRRGAQSVRHHVDGHLHRHPGAQHAAVRYVDDADHHAAADALGWHHATRKHARDRAEHHAGRTHHPFRGTEPGHPLSGRGAGDGVAALPGAGLDRRGAVFPVAGTLSQNDRPDGLMTARLGINPVRSLTMSNETIPLNLFKANLELQLRLQRLMQENGQQWLENATRAGSENIAESGTEIESLLKAQNWQELATLPAQAFWRQFQHQMGGAQALTQVAIKNQTTFTQGLQQAIQDWQKSVTQAVGQADAILPFQDIFKQWGAVWAKAQDKDAPAKTGGRNAG
jgi:hypothetical protein